MHTNNSWERSSFQKVLNREQNKGIKLSLIRTQLSKMEFLFSELKDYSIEDIKKFTELQWLSKNHLGKDAQEYMNLFNNFGASPNWNSECCGLSKFSIVHFFKETYHYVKSILENIATDLQTEIDGINKQKEIEEKNILLNSLEAEIKEKTKLLKELKSKKKEEKDEEEIAGKSE